MIRSALMALGLSAGAASAQGFLPTSSLVETCGGTRFTLDAVLDETDPVSWSTAGDVISARLGGLYGGTFDYTQVNGTQMVVSFPDGIAFERSQIEPMLETISFGFHTVDRATDFADGVVLKDGQQILPDIYDVPRYYVINYPPILTNDVFEDVDVAPDYNNVLSVTFKMNSAGSAIFRDYTAAHIGEPFAIVLRDQVISVPIIQSPIDTGRGQITSVGSDAETRELAAIMKSGTLPFDLVIVDETRVDGSDPSADFCP